MAQDVKTIQGTAVADTKTVQGTVIADVKTVMGVDNTSSGSASPFIADNVAGFDHWWSVAANQRAAYAGSCFRVRRSSDDAEQDIGFDGDGLMDEASLLTFVGANNGFVVTIYDQIGSANMTQATAASQPKIVTTGVVEKDSGNVPVMVFDGSNDWLAVTSAGTPTNFPISLITYGQATTGVFFSVCDSAVANRMHWISASGASLFECISQNTTFRIATGTTAINTGRFFLAGLITASNARAAYVSGVSEGTNTGAANWFTPTTMALGRLNDTTPSAYLTGELSDVGYAGVSVASDLTELNTLWGAGL